jgi:hypothetical protein
MRRDHPWLKAISFVLVISLCAGFYMGQAWASDDNADEEKNGDADKSGALAMNS